MREVSTLTSSWASRVCKALVIAWRAAAAAASAAANAWISMGWLLFAPRSTGKRSLAKSA